MQKMGGTGGFMHGPITNSYLPQAVIQQVPIISPMANVSQWCPPPQTTDCTGYHFCAPIGPQGLPLPWGNVYPAPWGNGLPGMGPRGVRK